MFSDSGSEETREAEDSLFPTLFGVGVKSCLFLRLHSKISLLKGEEAAGAQRGLIHPVLSLQFPKLNDQLLKISHYLPERPTGT